jgi:hypothetical protein
VGLAALSGIVWFGQFLFRIQVETKWLGHPFWEEMIHRWIKGPPPYDDIPRYVTEGYSDYLQRRNEFWTMYGQILVAIVMIIVLSILLLANTISAEAGLPILSGISGFAIAKGVSGGKSVSMPSQERQRG